MTGPEAKAEPRLWHPRISNASRPPPFVKSLGGMGSRVAERGALLLALLGGFVYIVGRWWVVAFYGAFDTSPEEVGLSQPALVVRMVPSLVFLLFVAVTTFGAIRFFGWLFNLYRGRVSVHLPRRYRANGRLPRGASLFLDLIYGRGTLGALTVLRSANLRVSTSIPGSGSDWHCVRCRDAARDLAHKRTKGGKTRLSSVDTRTPGYSLRARSVD